MSWGAPQWLWAFVALPLFGFALLATLTGRKARFTRFAKPAVWQRIAPELDFNARIRKGWVLLVASVFLIFAAARPRWGTIEESIQVSGMDILVAFDVSNSMWVEDIAPSRLKKGRHVLQTLVDSLGGDRVGVVAFAASAYLACPLTNDLDYVKETVSTLEPAIILNQGTDLGTAIDTATRALERGAENPHAAGTEAPEPAAASSRAIVLVSDGEDHEELALTAARKAREAGIRLYVLGIGTEAGGPMPVRDDNGVLRGYKRDRKGEPIVSRFRSDALRRVADAGGGRYWNVTDAETEVNELVKDLGGMTRSESTMRRYVVHQERFQYPLVIAILLLLVELSMPARKILGFLLLLGGVLTGSGFTKDARAEGLRTYMENQKGLKAFEAGKMDEARRSFGNAQSLDPDSPQIRFNHGVVELKNGNVDQAIQDFGASAEAAHDKDPTFGAKALFNLGAALQAKGDSTAARQSYLRSLRMAKHAGDTATEVSARKNLELLDRKEKEQKKDQQKQDKDQKQDQDQDQKQDQKQDQDQKRDQDQKQQGEGKDPEKKDGKEQDPNQDPSKDQGKDQPKQLKDPSQQGRRQFRSEKLSKEDAERVMGELSQRERELQQKLRRQKGSPQANEKDW